MVAKIELGPRIGHSSKEIRIIAVHMHNTIVNGKWKPELQFYWTCVHALYA
jgi:hypothetical protein